MEGWIVIASIAALVCAGINWLAPGAVLDGIGFAIAAGVLSAVNAGRLRHPVWSGLLALMTVAGAVSMWSSLPISASYFDLYGPFRPALDTVWEHRIVLFATTVALPLPTPQGGGFLGRSPRTRQGGNLAVTAFHAR
jgi:hypothetical protein